MNYEFYYDKNVNLPRVRCDDEIEALVGTFLTSDVGGSKKLIDLLIRKVERVKSGVKKTDSYPGEMCTLFLKGDIAVVSDNGLMFEEPTSCSMRLVKFESLLNSWNQFVHECNSL